jgi:hypothetical protein
LHGDIDAINRALRDINRIPDADTVRILKGILERQSRMLARLLALESRRAENDQRRAPT